MIISHHSPTRQREAGSRILDREPGILLQELLYDPFALFGFHGADPVHQDSTWCERSGGGGQDPALSFGMGGQVGLLQTPPDLRMASEGAGPAARSVHENGVELPLHNRFL